MNGGRQLHRYTIGFILGVVVALGLIKVRHFFISFFVGSPIVCQDSFPRYHTACIYSRFGIGEQAITLEIDNRSVFSAADLPGGDLKERITWDSSGRFVTFHVDGLGAKRIDAEFKILVE